MAQRCNCALTHTKRLALMNHGQTYVWQVVFLLPHIQQLCRLMQPFIWILASSVNVMLCIKLASLSIFSSISSANSFLFGLSAALIFWSSWILYACNLSFVWRTLCTIGLGIPNSSLCRGINLCGLHMKDCQVFSAISSITAGLPGDSRTNRPVSWNCSNRQWMFTCRVDSF